MVLNKVVMLHSIICPFSFAMLYYDFGSLFTISVITIFMKKGFVVDLETATLENTDYRRVLYTAGNIQLVLMHLEPGVEIGEEVHELDQFIRVDGGVATVMLGDEFHELSDGHAVIVPAGVKHNVLNKSDEPVNLYSVYGPPEHKDGIVQKTKQDEKEEHWDKETTE